MRRVFCIKAKLAADVADGSKRRHRRPRGLSLLCLQERTSPVGLAMSASCQDRTHASQQKVDGDLIMMRDYEPSDAATWRMLASATGMAAALSFGCVFV